MERSWRPRGSSLIDHCAKRDRPEARDRVILYLVLLRHKFLGECRTVEPPQHGQRGKHLMTAAMSLRRMVAIEFGMCRSGRKGGSSGSVTSPRYVRYVVAIG
jgi:hypothetical protein